MQQPVAVISGAGRGIGRATAVELSRLNYRTVLLARGRDELQQTADECNGGLILPTDVSDAGQVDRAMQMALDALGRIDAVVHCAGLAPVRSIAEMSIEQWHAVLDTNLSAAFYLMRSAWPAFKRQNSGVMVNVSSAAARDPFPNFGAYAAAKAGVNLLGLVAAREGQSMGIRVHTIAPSATETAMFRQIMTEEQYPPDKTLAPADVARIIAQCVTGELRYTSGEVIYVHKQA